MARTTDRADAAHAEHFHLVGGRLALDFVNTADWADRKRDEEEAGRRSESIEREHLETPADLRRWVRTVGLNGMTDGADGAVLAEMRSFRAHLREVLTSALEDRSANEVARRAVAVALQQASTGTPIAPVSAPPRTDGTLALKAALAVSALAVLTDRREIDRVKMCEGSNCGWLFVDESRGRNRRWCRMETCGNRAKARRHYRARSGT